MFFLILSSCKTNKNNPLNVRLANVSNVIILYKTIVSDFLNMNLTRFLKFGAHVGFARKLAGVI